MSLPVNIHETDDEYNYFLAVLPVHPEFLNAGIDSVEESPGNLLITPRILQILRFCAEPKKRNEILEHIGLSFETRNYKRNIEPLIVNGLLDFTDRTSVRSPQQRYFTTDAGKELIKKDSQ